MSAVPGQGEAACRFAKALGLDPRKTRSIHLSMDINNVVLVSVEMYVQESELNDLGLELKQFELVEKKPKVEFRVDGKELVQKLGYNVKPNEKQL